MSASLVWTPVPVDPSPLGSSKSQIMGLVAAAYEFDSIDDLSVAVALEAGSTEHHRLQGALIVLDAVGHQTGWTQPAAVDLAALLAAVEDRGEVLVQVQR